MLGMIITNSGASYLEATVAFGTDWKHTGVENVVD